MKNKFLKKITAIFLLLVISSNFFNYNCVHAEINSQYSQNTSISISDEGSIAKAVVGFIADVILGALGKAIVGIAFCVEVLVRGLCGLLTLDINNAVFPWADRVIFNGMPLLDVNFINPAENSMFMGSNNQFTGIGNTIRNIYFTGLSIGLGFLGVIVAVMAIRIAISTIASEKAKYKEAIVHWATALILLFAMHYVISFVFYLNEQLVEVASSMVMDLMADKQTILNQIGSAFTNNYTPIEQMGDWFRTRALESWDVESFTSAILYAVFIVQSLMFYWAYFKRFFYVVILAIISPFVVIFDFLKKAVF